MIKRSISAAAGLALAIWSAGAIAQTSPQPVAKPIGPGVDWSLRGFAVQRFEFDSNRELDPESDGAVYGSISTLGLRMDARTKRALFSVNAGFSGRYYGGPGDTENLNTINPNIAASLTYNGKDYQISNQMALSVQPTTETQFEDSGIVDEDANQFTFSYSTGYAHLIDARNTWSLNGDIRIIRFDEDVDDLNESESAGINTSWRHQLSQTTFLFARTGFRYFNADDDSQSQTVDFTTGVDHQRTSRHQFGASGGVSVVRSEDQDTPGEDAEINVGFNGGANFSYRVKRFNAGLNFSQSLDPSSDGDVDAFTRLSGSVGYQITRFSSLSGTASLSRRTSLSDATGSDSDEGQFLSLGPTFRTQLTDTVDLSIGYQFRLDDESDSDIGTGHQMFLTISKNFEVIE